MAGLVAVFLIVAGVVGASFTVILIVAAEISAKDQGGAPIKTLRAVQRLGQHDDSGNSLADRSRR